jgi:hypothetical protein
MKQRSDVNVIRVVCHGSIALAAFVLFVGCGGETTSNRETKTGNDGATTEPPKNVNFDADIGALDQTKVNATLNRTSDKLTACFSEGLRRIPFLGGNIKFALRINQKGVATVAYMKESTLGDRTTETCMLDALRAASWPAPVGGREGLAEGGLGFDPSPDERPAVDLDADKLGKKELPKAKAAIEKCRSSAGAGAITTTLYVGTDGKPMGVGVAVADAKGEEAATCVVDALRAMTFASPGSYAGKVSIAAD